MPLDEIDTVYPSIASHPDIFFFQIDSGAMICSPLISAKLLSEISDCNIRVIYSQKDPRGDYPDTAKLNCARIGRFIFHNSAITDEAIKKAAEEQELTLVHCSQGYARCSTIPVRDGAIITSDAGIARSAIKVEVDTLLISPGNCVLPGERSGFIGGATGILPDSTIVFLGDISKHPDFMAIDNFLQKHGVGYIDLKALPLYDAGSLIFVG
jgi:hypothetical protein